MQNMPKEWDEEFYLAHNEDIEKAVTQKLFASGYEHFINHGINESRQYRFTSNAPLPLDWSDLDYLNANPDLKSLQSTGSTALYEHWTRSGRFDGRGRSRDQVKTHAEKFGANEKVVGEMLLQAQFEPALFPADYFNRDPEKTCLQWMAYKGEMLKRFMEELAALNVTAEKLGTFISPLPRNQFTHIILVPWLKTGGADKAAILFANAIAEQQGTKVLMLSTEKTDSPWQDRLHPNVDFFEFGNFFGSLDYIPTTLSLLEQRELLAAYLLDNSPQVVHVLNSHLGWYLLGKYGRALKSKMNLWTSLYCYDFTEEGEPVGYARYIRLVADSLTGIFSDNTKFPDELADSYGIDRNLFVTTWHPVALKKNIRNFDFDPSSNNVLWASRLDRQKRPDVLLRVARQCPELRFHVYGDSVMGDASANEFLKLASAQPNIVYYGSYSSLNEIKRIPYRAFLYTSQWDGLPNILLEMGLLGLPIIAPQIGGISDLVVPETGYPVAACESVPEYSKALRAIPNEDTEANTKVQRMRRLIEMRHSSESFTSVLSEYIRPSVSKAKFQQ